MKLWSLLPNADHINRVIRSVKSNSAMWSAAWDAAPTTATSREAAWDRAQNAVHDADRNWAWAATWEEACDATMAVRDTLLALIAYDDCDWYLAMNYEQLSVYAVISDKSQAVLLLPMKWVQENETLVTAT